MSLAAERMQTKEVAVIDFQALEAMANFLNVFHIPQSTKKILLRLAIISLNTLVVSARLMKKGFFGFNGPANWAWRKLVLPSMTGFYKKYRFVKLIIKDIFSFFSGNAVRFFTSKHAVQAAVILLAALVTTNNIKAGELTAVNSDEKNEHSILETVTFSDFTDEVVEQEYLDDAPSMAEVSYLTNEAIKSLAVENIVEGEAETADEGWMYRPEIFASAIDAMGLGDIEESVTTSSEATPQPAEKRSGFVQYVVEQGDSAGRIANRFGLTVSTVLSANGLTSRSVIQPGDKLRIPPTDGIIYKVKSGDTLGRIASYLSVDSRDIAETNGLGDGSVISIGMELVVPGGKMPAVKATTTPTRIASSIRNVITPPASTEVSNSKLLWPSSARRISQYYKGSSHFGLDIAAPTGTPIYAAESGVVLTSGWNSSGYGYMIVIDHGGGLYTRYAHHSKLLVSAGDSVARGDVIGLMGSTGRSTGPHLHFEVLVGGLLNRRNPLDYIR